MQISPQQHQVYHDYFFKQFCSHPLFWEFFKQLRTVPPFVTAHTFRTQRIDGIGRGRLGNLFSQNDDFKYATMRATKMGSNVIASKTPVTYPVCE